MSEFVLDETERIHGGPGGVRVLSIALVVIDGPSRGLRVRVDGGKARVGTSEGSTLRLSDRAVSRIHCELDVQADVVTLRDLGSTTARSWATSAYAMPTSVWVRPSAAAAPPS